MPFQRDQFGHSAYVYEPTWDVLRDMNPDHNRSFSRMVVVEEGRDLVWYLEVQGLGVLTMHATSERESGRLLFHGVAISPDGVVPAAKGE